MRVCNRHIKLARNMALKSQSRFRLGAVLVKKKRVISTGYNQMKKTHTKMQIFNPKNHSVGLHAEVHCTLGVALADLYGAEIFVARVLRNDQLAMAKPCEICRKFLASVGIRSITYTTENTIEHLDL